MEVDLTFFFRGSSSHRPNSIQRAKLRKGKNATSPRAWGRPWEHVPAGRTRKLNVFNQSPMTTPLLQQIKQLFLLVYQLDIDILLIDTRLDHHSRQLLSFLLPQVID